MSTMFLKIYKLSDDTENILKIQSAEANNNRNPPSSKQSKSKSRYNARCQIQRKLEVYSPNNLPKNPNQTDNDFLHPYHQQLGKIYKLKLKHKNNTKTQNKAQRFKAVKVSLIVQRPRNNLKTSNSIKVTFWRKILQNKTIPRA